MHTLNNLAIVVWALFSHLDDFGGAIGEAVGAGLDTDCNGATVGGLWGIDAEAPRARRNVTRWMRLDGRRARGLACRPMDVLLTHESPRDAIFADSGS